MSRSLTLADLYLQCCGTVEGEQGTMPTLPNLNSLGRLCSTSRSHSVNRVRVKRKSSVKRMSIIEDGHVAEVLYLIPKQYMEMLPFLNPNDYYLSEKLNDVATGRTKEQMKFDLFLHTSLNFLVVADLELQRHLISEQQKHHLKWTELINYNNF